MGADCCHPHSEPATDDPAWRRVLWIALILNFLMFCVEVLSAFRSQSVSLQADSLDFLGDSFNYGISLWVAGQSLVARARVSIFKGMTMLLLGVWVLIQTGLKLTSQTIPEAQIMGWVGFLALVVNVSVAVMLLRFKDGDSNRQSIWLCTRNDAIGNLLVIVSASLVFYFNAGWPDWLVGLILAALGIQSGFKVIQLARSELLQEHQAQLGHKGDHHESH